MRNPVRRGYPGRLGLAAFLALAYLQSPATAQNAALALSSGSAKAGSSVTLNLSLTSPPGGAASVKWTLAYNPSSVTGVNVSAAGTTNAAGKSISCTSGTGQDACVLSGADAIAIPNGPIAFVTVTLSGSAAGTVSVAVVNTSALSPGGTPIGISSSGGNISVISSTGPAPTAPGNLTAVARASDVLLSWTASTGEAGISGYQVLRSQSAGGPYTQLNTAPATGTTYDDTNVKTGNTYYYEVIASDLAGNQSPPSNQVSATVPIGPVTPPTAPGNLAAVSQSSDILLTWTASTSAAGISGYQVLRSQSAGGPYTQINPAPVTTTTYEDGSVQSGVTYYYVVTARDINGNQSSFSNQVSATAVLSSMIISLQDIFGRNLNQHGLTLVDWDGYLANPAIKFFVVPPANAQFPATATLSANDQRLYFDLPSTVGPSGPTKTISFQNPGAPVAVYLGNAPDRDTTDADFQLSIQFTGADNQTASLTVPIHKIDQDQPPSSPVFDITTDFTQDQTGFFASSQTRDVIQQELADWAYFFDDLKLDPVPAGTESTLIWNPDGFITERTVTNASAYTGYLVYVYGIHSSMLRSGGEPSMQGGLQSSGGVQLPLKRSGGVEIETAGNYNTLGWLTGTADVGWWVSGNLGSEQNELFSISHHESGHALAFDPAQPKWAAFKQNGCVNDPVVIAYHGSCPKIDPSDHLSGEIDNASLKGAFGNEYFGSVPARRWWITKLDLLVAQAVGYKLRTTSAFVPLSIATTTLAAGVVGQQYAQPLKAVGGIPFYNWRIASGQLPDGLQLDSFSGELSGVPTKSGTFQFTIQVQEYVDGSAGVTGQFTMTVGSSPAPLPGVSAVNCPATLSSGNSATCFVVLTSSSGSAAVVSIFGSSSLVTAPATVIVPAGSTTASFTVTAGTVTTSQIVTVAATLNGTVGKATLSLTPILISALNCTPNPLSSGASATCSVGLTSASNTAIAISIFGSSTVLSVPAAVTVPAGAASASFIVTAGAITANQDVTVTAVLNGSAGKAVLSLIPGPPIPVIGRVVNGASFVQGQGVAPGSFVAIYGSNFATGFAQAGLIPLPASLANVRVTFNGISGSMVAVGHDVDSNHEDQINVQLPWEVLAPGAPSGTAQAVVTVNGIASAAVSVPILSAAPGLFYITRDTTGVARPAAYNNSDGTLPLPASIVISTFQSRPAKIGDPAGLALFATGLGPVSITPPDGAPPENMSTTLTTPVVMVGGLQEQVVFSGLSEQFPGVYQVNIILQPGTPTGDAVAVQIQMNGITTTDQLRIAVTI